MTRTRTLDNGLRLQLIHRPGALSAAVATHVGVGYRSDPPGRAGTAHLFEHLMTQDAPPPLRARTIARAQASGGSTGASTHPDHTRFSCRVPVASLGDVLRWEAERLRAPRFTERHLAEQKAGVFAEIEARLHGGAGGAFPWPALAGLTSPEGRDRLGLGHPGELEGVGYDDCLRFFTDHYAPGAVVLTIVTDLERAGASLDAPHLDDLFAAVPARPVPGSGRPGARLSGDVHADVRAPGLDRPHVALALPVPGTAGGAEAYATALVVAAALGDTGDGPRDDGHLRASCGWFGPGDSRDDDVLVVVGTTDDPDPRAAVLDSVDRALERLADPRGVDDLPRRAADRVLADLRRQQRGALEVALWAGRGELLHGQADQLDRLTAAAAGVSCSGIAQLAAALRSGPRAVLLGLPAGAHAGSRLPPSSTRPEHAPGRGPRPALPPAWHCRPADLEVRCEVVGGMPVLAVLRDAPGTSLRLHLHIPSLPPWRRAALGRWLASAPALRRTGAVATAAAFGDDLVLSVEAGPGRLDRWLEVLGHLADRAVAVAAVPDRADRRPPADAPDLAGWLAEGDRDPGLLPGPAATVVVVGDLTGLPPGRPMSGEYATVPLATGPRDGGAVRHVVSPSAVAAVALRTRPGAVRDPAAEHLAVALLAGVGGLSAGRLTRLGALRSGTATAGRAPTVGGRTAVVTGQAPPGCGSELLAEVTAVLRGHSDGLPPLELEAAQAFCCGQWQIAFDETDGLADLVVQQHALGRPPEQLAGFVDLLAGARADDVLAAWQQLFDPSGLGGVLVDSG